MLDAKNLKEVHVYKCPVRGIRNLEGFLPSSTVGVLNPSPNSDFH
jgi:hypothetical protein